MGKTKKKMHKKLFYILCFVWNPNLMIKSVYTCSKECLNDF